MRFARFATTRFKIAEEIPESKYDFKPAPDAGASAQLLAHIALGPAFQLHIQSNKIDDLKKVELRRSSCRNRRRGSQAADEGRDRSRS